MIWDGRVSNHQQFACAKSNVRERFNFYCFRLVQHVVEQVLRDAPLHLNEQSQMALILINDTVKYLLTEAGLICDRQEKRQDIFFEVFEGVEILNRELLELDDN